MASFLRYARELFDDADMDGSFSVDQRELTQLMSNVLGPGKMGQKELKEEDKSSLDKLIESVAF